MRLFSDTSLISLLELVSFSQEGTVACHLDSVSFELCSILGVSFDQRVVLRIGRFFLSFLVH